MARHGGLSKRSNVMRLTKEIKKQALEDFSNETGNNIIHADDLLAGSMVSLTIQHIMFSLGKMMLPWRMSAGFKYSAKTLAASE